MKGDEKILIVDDEASFLLEYFFISKIKIISLYKVIVFTIFSDNSCANTCHPVLFHKIYLAHILLDTIMNSQLDDN